MVADSIEGFYTEVQRLECDIGTPDSVIKSAVKIRRQRIFGRVTARPVAAVMAEGDRFGERHIEAEGSTHRAGHLGYFKGVSESCSLMIVREDENLGFPRETTKCGGVQDAVTVAFETGASAIWSLLDQARPCSVASSSPKAHRLVFDLFTNGPVQGCTAGHLDMSIDMSVFNTVDVVATHCGAPLDLAFSEVFGGPHRSEPRSPLP